MKPLLTLVLAASVLPLYAQEPGQPPPVIQITREAVKEGRGAAHRRVESDYVNVFRKNKYPFHYLALNTTSGASEAWFLTAYPNFAAMEESDKLSDKAPLKNDLELVEGRDGELRTSSRTMTAMFRKDLSYLPANALPIAKTRYVMISTYRIKLGKEEELMQGGKMILAALEKSKSTASTISYQVVAGAPEGIYLFMFPMASMKEMDDAPAREKAFVEAMGAENFGRLMKGTGDVFQSMESTLFAVAPDMSYMPKEVEDADPAFWKPKSAGTSAPAKAKTEKSGQ